MTTGEKFDAITQTDLETDLRERGWKVGNSGDFLYLVEKARFTVTQAYQFQGGRVKRASASARTLPKYSTLVTL